MSERTPSGTLPGHIPYDRTLSAPRLRALAADATTGPLRARLLEEAERPGSPGGCVLQATMLDLGGILGIDKLVLAGLDPGTEKLGTPRTGQSPCPQAPGVRQNCASRGLFGASVEREGLPVRHYLPLIVTASERRLPADRQRVVTTRRRHGFP
jgi:hypothetical protein